MIPGWIRDPVMLLECAYLCSLLAQALRDEGSSEGDQGVAWSSVVLWLDMMSDAAGGIDPDWRLALYAARLRQGGDVHPDVCAYMEARQIGLDVTTGLA